MKFVLQSPVKMEELKLMQQLFEWQGLPCKTQITSGALKHSRGHPKPVLLVDDKCVAIGFWALCDYIEMSGLANV